MNMYTSVRPKRFTSSAYVTRTKKLRKANLTWARTQNKRCSRPTKEVGKIGNLGRQSAL